MDSTFGGFDFLLKFWVVLQESGFSKGNEKSTNTLCLQLIYYNYLELSNPKEMCRDIHMKI